MAGRIPQGANTRASKAEEESVKEEIRKYLAENIQEILNDINALPVKERTAQRMKLLDYIMPKVQSVRAAEVNRQSVSDVLLANDADDDDEDFS